MREKRTLSAMEWECSNAEFQRVLKKVTSKEATNAILPVKGKEGHKI
jgi:hypothetical protein